MNLLWSIASDNATKSEETIAGKQVLVFAILRDSIEKRLKSSGGTNARENQ